jgi:hypothetical protein
MVSGVDGLNWDLEGNEGVFGLPFARGLGDRRFADGLTNVMRTLKTEGLKRNPRFQMSFCAPVYVNQTTYLASANLTALDQYIDLWIPMGCESSPILHSERRIHCLSATAAVWALCQHAR